MFGAASSGAAQVDALFLALVLLCGLVALAITVVAGVFVFHYHDSREVNRDNPPANLPRVELFWTTGTLLAFLFLFLWGASLYAFIDMLSPPDDALDIYVVGKQWVWKVQHPEGRREVNSLHVPTGRPIRLVMTSEDVIHSFFLPDFRVKKDVVPGRYTIMWFEPERTGTYDLLCAEYCGSAHSRMRGRVVVMEPEEYARWLERGDRGGLVAQGERYYRNFGCSGCHAPASTVHAPRLEGLFGRPVHLIDGTTTLADEAYVRDSILLPRKDIVAGFAPIMPSFEGQVGEGEMLALIAYIKSLSREGGASR